MSKSTTLAWSLQFCLSSGLISTLGICKYKLGMTAGEVRVGEGKGNDEGTGFSWHQGPGLQITFTDVRLRCPNWRENLRSIICPKINQTMYLREGVMDWKKCRIFTSDKPKMELPWRGIKMLSCTEINLVVLTNGTCPNIYYGTVHRAIPCKNWQLQGIKWTWEWWTSCIQ